MKRLVPVLTIAAFAVATAAYAASPAEGLWRTATRNGEVRIDECGQALCGTLVTSDSIKANPAMADAQNKDAAKRTRLLKDLPMLQGFTGGPSQWKGGTVYNPEDGGTYKGTIKLVDADTLKLTGCIVFPLCKSQTWKRIR
ncbi:MAG: hypothetical protein B7Y99_12070 [Caulobacterales bacterium 32-69-10]|nr:MAG: hypothetical protein B7Y99_12070 [Caulobacterales bacterium 32-69-10]